MSIVEDARQAMSQQTFELPPTIPVVRWEVDDITDHDGEAALKVLLVLDESVQPGQIDGRDLMNLKRAIHDSFQQKGLTLFPYVFIARQSDLDEPVED